MALRILSWEPAPCRNLAWSALFLLLATGGLRISEALGLRWEDVDCGARTVAIQRAFVWGPFNYTAQEPKSEAGWRVRYPTERGSIRARWDAAPASTWRPGLPDSKRHGPS